MAQASQPVRAPAVAGSFYPGHPLQLRVAVERLLVRTMEPVRAVSLIAPHAGYVYSGATAGKTYAAVELPPSLLILCPNHTGLGSPLSCMSEGAWATPLGAAPIHTELARALIAELPELQDDALAHRREHAIEVQLPFLQVLLGEFRFVPICVGTQRFQSLSALGRAIATVAAGWPDPVALVVSSDMNHYEPAETNRVKDEAALEAILHLSPEELFKTVIDRHVTMCGFAPAVAALTACRALGVDRAQVVDYTHSGMVTGDDTEVVSYAGVRLFKEAA